MQFTELLTTVNHLTTKEEVEICFKALRQDELIWKGVLDFTSDPISLEKLIEKGETMNTRSISLLSIDPLIDLTKYPKTSFTGEVLERLMFEYEAYIQSETAIHQFSQAAVLAAALIEKRKITAQWKNVVLEILSRMKITSSEKFEHFWKTVFAITSNLAEDKDEFFTDLLALQQPEIGLGIFVHSILCLPVNETEKADLLVNQLQHTGAQLQSNALRKLYESSNPGLVRSVATRLLERYSNINLDEQPSSNYWNNPSSSLQFALQCQSAADIAQFAGDTPTALAFTNKSLEILNAIGIISKIKMAGMNNDGIPAISKEQFSEKELAQPEIVSELVYGRIGNDSEVASNQKVYPVKVLHQSQEMIAAGNSELACQELDKVFTALTDDEVEEMLFNGSRFNPNWDAVEVLEILLESNANEKAARVANILLHRNPTNERINLAAVKAFEKSSNFASETKGWETLAVLNPYSVEIKRNLGKAYQKTGNIEDAYAVMNSLVSGEEQAEESDLLEFAEIALGLGKTEEVLRAAGKVLDQNAENSSALTFSGLAYFKKGEVDAAIKSLEKAIEIPGDDPRSWIVLSDIYAQNGDLDKSLNILKEGLAANPDQKSLEVAYAKGLMQIGSTADAYPLLRRLSDSVTDHEIDVLLIDAMKQLGIEDIGVVLDEIMKRYPDDIHVQAEYGKNLVDNGKLSEGLAVLKNIRSEISENSDWMTAYVEALLNNDASGFRFTQKIANKELNEAIGLIDKAIDNKPENTKAKILKGELLTKLHKFNEAISIFGQILETEKTLEEKWLARLNADLAKSAAAVGKYEIALASIEEAINIQPDWIGLQQEKTEILMLANELTQAETQLAHTLEVCPNSVENSIWAAQMLHKLGKTDEAEQILGSALEKSPKSLGLQVLAMELTGNQDRPDSSADQLEKLKTLIANSNDANEIIRAAAVLAKYGQDEDVITALRRAGELGSVDAWINLAGLYRSLEDQVRCLETLGRIEEMDPVVSLFKAEVEFHTGNIEKAYELISNSSNDPVDFDFEPVFLPGMWQEFLNSTNPKMFLWLTMDLQNSCSQDSLERANEWIKAYPNNGEAYIFGIEVALACGAKDAYDNFLNISQNEGTNRQSRQLDMLRIERDQDQQIFALSAEDSNGDVNCETGNDPVLITRVRSLVAEGQLSDAELKFTEFIADFSDLQRTSCIFRIGLLRNTIKAAMSVNRWKDAVDLFKQYGREFTSNDGMNLIFLETLVRAVEFFNSAQGLEVDTHLPWNALYVASLQEDINTLALNVRKDRIEKTQHWVLRGNLALNPDHENVRALALITPQADDVAAMMAGLRATDQVNIALQVARKFENAPCVLFELAQCLCEDETDKAVEVLQRSLEISPDQPLSLRMLSKLEEILGNRMEAAENLELAINLWPNEPRWHTKAADLLTELGNLDAPVDHLQAALEINPNNTDVLFKLGMAHIMRQDPESGLKCLNEMANKEPNRADVWEAIADAHQVAGNFNQALEAAEKASNADPFAVRPHLQAGKVYWNQGEIEKALNQVKLAISLDPEDADSYVFLARLLQEKEENGKALETLERASQCKTVTVRTLIEHATLLKKINGAAAARDLLATFSQKFPENPELLKLLAEAEEECGDLRKAEAAAKRALEMHPEETELHLFLGNIQEKNGNLDQAAHYFSQAIVHDPNEADAYIKLSQAFAKQREFGKAREVLEEGIRRAPEDIDLYMACANLLKDAKDYRAAEQMLRKASTIDPRNLAVHRQLGAVLALNLVHQSQEVSSHL